MATWIEAGAVHTLEAGAVVVATITLDDGTARFVIHVDPADGIQRANEPMRLEGMALGGLLSAKRTIHGRLARFGFARYIPKTEASKHRAPKKAAPKRTPTKKAAPTAAKKAAPKRKPATAKKKS